MKVRVLMEKEEKIIVVFEVRNTLEGCNDKLIKILYRELIDKFDEQPDNWENIIEEFKRGVLSVLGFFWKKVDLAFLEKEGPQKGWYSGGVSIQKIAQKKVALIEGVLDKIFETYEEETKEDISIILQSLLDNDDFNILHHLANTICREYS
ncbi:MAG TPA: hypothetical protein VN854_00745, partial [Mycoplasmatales bacterium]|nr:hypothetical protein [Mycoplasmatales bacterium]